MSGAGARYIQMQSEPMPSTMASFFSFRQSPESTWIFDELPKATIISVSRPDASDITPMLLSYTIEFRYKQAWSSNLFHFILLFLFSGFNFIVVTPLFVFVWEKRYGRMNHNLDLYFPFHFRLGLELLFSDFINS